MAKKTFQQLRVSPEEKEQLRAKAMQEGYSSVADYMRDRIFLEGQSDNADTSTSEYDDDLGGDFEEEEEEEEFSHSAQRPTHQEQPAPPQFGGFGLGALPSNDVGIALNIQALNFKVQSLTEKVGDLKIENSELKKENKTLEAENKRLQDEVDEDNRAEKRQNRNLEMAKTISGIIPDEAKGQLLSGLMGFKGIGGTPQLSEEDQDNMELGSQLKEAFKGQGEFKAYMEITTVLGQDKDALKKVHKLITDKIRKANGSQSNQDNHN